jgi:tyrosine-protein phosphatase SIW14
MSFRTGSLISLFVIGLPTFAASPAVPGIDRFCKLNESVYRGGQPTDEGFRYLAKLGVKVVLDLREQDARASSEERVVTAAGMRYVNVPMTGLTPPTLAETDKILKLLEDPADGPVFVHCKRGADRTGAVIAAYRIEHDHWDNARALREAKDMGMGALQFQRREYIRSYQARTTESAGVKPPLLNPSVAVSLAAAK